MQKRTNTFRMPSQAQNPTDAWTKCQARSRKRICRMLVAVATLSAIVARPDTFAANAHAAQEAGVPFADTLTQNGKHLQLNGLGLRTKFFFKVYVAGLYVEEKSTDPVTLLSSRGEKLLKLHFLRDVDAEKIREAWIEGYKANCLDRCEETATDVETLNGWMRDMKDGDTLEFSFTDNTLTVTVNGENKGSISTPAFAQNILAIFLGKNPPNNDLKEGLLGKG